MTVRDARPDDLPALRAVQEATLAEPWPDLLALGVDGPPLCLVAATPDPVGYALATVGDDSVGYLVELAVAPHAQGRGHGSALLERLVERLGEADVDRLRVTVRVVDERAREFYRDRGFECEARLPDRYDAGDGLLLVREIDA